MAKEQAGEKIMPNDDVTIYGTGASKHMQAGKPYTVHKMLADKLVKKGAASFEANSKPAKQKGGTV